MLCKVETNRCSDYLPLYQSGEATLGSDEYYSTTSTLRYGDLWGLAMETYGLWDRFAAGTGLQRHTCTRTVELSRMSGHPIPTATTVLARSRSIYSVQYTGRIL